MTILIRAGRVIDGSGGPPLDNAYVVVEGKHIAGVGVGEPETIPADGYVLDVRDATLVPGLIDCHVHLGGFHDSVVMGRDAAHAVASDSLAVTRGLNGLLMDGITSVRDCGYPHHGIFGVREAQSRGNSPGSRLFLSGRAICATGGHGASISVEADGPDAVRRVARMEMKAGADWIKLMMTGGTSTPNELVTDVQLTVEEAAAAVEEAHRRGRRVSAHCSNLAGTLAALDAGVDSIEHGIELDDGAVDRMVTNGTWLSPGIRCTRVEAEAGPESGIPEHVRVKAAEIFRFQEESFRRAYLAGVRIVAATDAGPGYLPLGSDSLVAELATMIDLGMSPLEAICAATGRASELLGVGNHMGKIGPGQLADLLVVRGDPLENVRALCDVVLVMKDGIVVRDERFPQSD